MAIMAARDVELPGMAKTDSFDYSECPLIAVSLIKALVELNQARLLLT